VAIAVSTASAFHLAWNSMARPLEALVRKEAATLEIAEDMAAATSSSSYTWENTFEKTLEMHGNDGGHAVKEGAHLVGPGAK
jgi:hypothetical protein